MIKEMFKDVYQLKIPLPGNPLKVLNSYLIKGTKKHLLVDTGFNWNACKEAQLNAIAKLGLKWADIDFFITHAHGDHSGLVYELASPDAKVYCSKADADLLKESMTIEYWEKSDAFYIMNGFPEKDMARYSDNMTDWISGTDIQFTHVEDGDIIKVGDYRFTCIFTPGHSPGHMCLYEPEFKFLISGDHILDSITSNITSWIGRDDFLGLYLSSLEKVNRLEIGLVLPGHREIITQPYKRIAELKKHHQKRLAEIVNILSKGPMNAYQVASHMDWDIKADSWQDFPSYQRWFATGEAIAHLEHLLKLNVIQQKIEKSERRFFQPLL